MKLYLHRHTMNLCLLQVNFRVRLTTVICFENHSFWILYFGLDLMIIKFISREAGVLKELRAHSQTVIAQHCDSMESSTQSPSQDNGRPLWHCLQELVWVW